MAKDIFIESQTARKPIKRIYERATIETSLAKLAQQDEKSPSTALTDSTIMLSRKKQCSDPIPTSTKN